jgi:hypothetical protein
VTGAGAFIANEGCHDATGGTAGGQFGYRWQSGTWVVGLEAQGNWTDLRGSNPSLAFPGTTIRSKVDAFGLITGQVGYAANNVLLYVKGGAAVTADRYRINTTAGNVLLATSNDDTRWGGVVGVGLRLLPELVGRHRIRSSVHVRIAPTPSRMRPASSATSASARTSISSPSASTIAGVARSSRSTDPR